ncbi:Sporulation protein YpeB [compost metagenome]
MQKDVLASNLRWMDVELALASESSKSDNIIIDGFKAVDKKVGEYPEINWGPSVTSMYQKRTMKLLSGNPVSAEEIRKKAAQFADSPSANIQVTENGQGSEYASYSATIDNGNGDGRLNLDFTKKGGQLILFMNSRKIGDKKISFDQAKAAADKFLEKHGFKGMNAVNYDMFNNTGSFTYVSKQNDVLIYPEKLTVKVALDQGEVVGLQANDYVYEHHDRELGTPTITQAEARKALNTDMKIKNEAFALINNELGEEVLCYEYMGQINGSMYRVYINAETGLEESIEEMSHYETKAALDK